MPCGRRTPLLLPPATSPSHLLLVTPPTHLLPSCHTLPATFLLYLSHSRPPATSLWKALSEAEKAKFMYPCDPWETCTPQLSETAAAAPASATTAAFPTPAPLPAPMLAPVLQGLNGPNVEEERNLEYSIKLKEYEIQLHQLRILQTQLHEAAAAQCMTPNHALAVAVAAPFKAPIHMHPAPGTAPIHMHGRATPTPAPGTAPIHVLAVPTGPSYSPTSLSFPSGSTVPSHGTSSQSYHTISPSFPPGTVPSHGTSSQGYRTTSQGYETTSPIYLQTTPSCSRTASWSHSHEPSSCSPSYAFAPAAPTAASFDSAATPDAPTEAPTIPVLSIGLMSAELEDMLTEALEEMTDDQVGRVVVSK